MHLSSRRLAHASSGRWAAQGIEQRANAFAAYLLMPRALVFEHLPDANRIERDDVQHLAGRLRVNNSALLWHLQNLDLIDAACRERLQDEMVTASIEAGQDYYEERIQERNQDYVQASR